jgi:hypothetical protein
MMPEMKGPGGPAPVPGPEDNPPVDCPGESGGPERFMPIIVGVIGEIQQ